MRVRRHPHLGATSMQAFGTPSESHRRLNREPPPAHRSGICEVALSAAATHSGDTRATLRTAPGTSRKGRAETAMDERTPGPAGMDGVYYLSDGGADWRPPPGAVAPAFAVPTEASPSGGGSRRFINGFGRRLAAPRCARARGRGSRAPVPAHCGPRWRAPVGALEGHGMRWFVARVRACEARATAALPLSVL